MNNTMSREIIEIPVEEIIPNRFQPRLTFDVEALNELANSIKEHGIIQPLVVRRIQDKFEIIAGERRYKAATLVGMKKVPCIVMNLNDNESAEVAVIENIQRKEMTSLEEAKSFKKILDKGYLTQDELAKRMGKTKVIAETGAGQHGVATATGAALFNMECTVFMGAEDIERQKLNVFRMEMLGAKVHPVTSGSSTLKDATNEAIRTWAERAEDTFYIIGSAVGPHPYPKMVKEFQRVISKEARKQILEKEGRLPDVVMACVGGGSNSIGMFADFIDDKDVKLVGVEAGGLGIETGKHASAMALGEVGILHGMKTYLLQDKDGNIELAHSISAGLDYPGVGPEHAYLRDSGRAQYVSVTDDEAMQALLELCKLEGIIPAIESSHALAYAIKAAKTMDKDKIIVVCLSGRGDKDVNTVQRYLNGEETNK